jgi:hypothetical protein
VRLVRSNVRFLAWIFLLTLPFIAAHIALASDPVGGPSLGFSPNADGTTVWPILGIPGASTLGQALNLGVEIRGAVVSPRQDYILALRTEDGQPIIRRLTSDPRDATPIDGTRRNSVIAISPSGSAAVLYDNDSKVLQVLHGFPASPSIVFESDASSIAGDITALAVSDDASLSLVGFSNNGSGSLWAVSSAGSKFVSATYATSLSFIVNSQDAVVGDSAVGEAFLLQRIVDAPQRFALISPGEGVTGLSGIAVSDDGRFAVVAGGASANVGIVDMQQSLRYVIPCNCKPNGVNRLTGTAVFRLNQPPDALVTILDLSSGKPRILVVPPAPKTALR